MMIHKTSQSGRIFKKKTPKVEKLKTHTGKAIVGGNQLTKSRHFVSFKVRDKNETKIKISTIFYAFSRTYSLGWLVMLLFIIEDFRPDHWLGHWR